MAQHAYLYLTANGTNIDGESTVTTAGRDKAIEIIEYGYGVQTAREVGHGMATGRRAHEPIRFIKRIDKASPLIHKALCTNQVVAGSIKFDRPNQQGDGTTEQFHTIKFTGGRVSSVRYSLPNTHDPVSSALPMVEEVQIVFHTITMTHTNGGVENTDDWSAMT